MSYRYILEPYAGTTSRFTCPQCGKSHKFTRYIDTETNQYIADNVGRCDRVDNCKYHYTPKQYFEENGGNKQAGRSIDRSKRTIRFNQGAYRSDKPVSYIDKNTFLKSLCAPDYEKNRLVNYLAKLCGHATASKLIEKYFIGNSDRWPGATIFWQVDIFGNIRTGKIIQYNQDTGKRVKEPDSRVAWVHKAINRPEFNLQQCFFGEHLLKGNNNPVCIVESEKTAILASVCVPDKIWLATGGIEGLTENKFRVLQGRNVEMYPDLNAYNKWLEKAAEFSHITRVTVSEYLERIATPEERKEGLDIADYLIPHLMQGKVNKLMNTLTNDFIVFTNQFAAGNKTADEYLAYSLETESKLKQHGISLDKFVAATIHNKSPGSDTL